MPQTQAFSDEELKAFFGGGPKPAAPKAAPPSGGGKVFSDDELQNFFNPPTNTTSTQRASRQTIAEQEFEKAQPLMKRTASGGRGPNEPGGGSVTEAEQTPERAPNAFASAFGGAGGGDALSLTPVQKQALSEFFLQGLESLGIQPSTSYMQDFAQTGRFIGRAAGGLAATGYGLVSTPLKTIKDLGEGFAATMAAGPAQMRSAQNPEQFMRGTAQTAMFTYPGLRGITAPFVSGTPEELMTRAAKVKSFQPFSADAAEGIGGAINAAVKKFEGPASRTMEAMARLKSRLDPKSNVPVTNLPDYYGQPGYWGGGTAAEAKDIPFKRDIPAGANPPASTTTPRVPPPLTQPQDPFAPRTNVPAVENTIGDKVRAGVSPETMQLLGTDKLDSIANNVQKIITDQGYNVMDRVDRVLGGESTRQRAMGLPDGQNIIDEYIKAVRQGNLYQVDRWGSQLSKLRTRLSKRSTPMPPPPG